MNPVPFRRPSLVCRGLLFVTALVLAGCETVSSTMPPARSAEGVFASLSLRLGELATDPDYGFTPEKPIKVGGGDKGPASERKFLSQLRGPKGEAVRFERQGSCCPFETPNGFMGRGMLDRYAVWIGDETTPRVLYLNMYDYERLLVPLGFTVGR